MVADPAVMKDSVENVPLVEEEVEAMMDEREADRSPRWEVCLIPKGSAVEEGHEVSETKGRRDEKGRQKLGGETTFKTLLFKYTVFFLYYSI